MTIGPDPITMMVLRSVLRGSLPFGLAPTRSDGKLLTGLRPEIYADSKKSMIAPLKSAGASTLGCVRSPP